MADDRPYPLGWTCPKDGDGKIAPLSALTDPCGEDLIVWSNATTTPATRHVAIPDADGPCQCVGCVGYASDREIDGSAQGLQPNAAVDGQNSDGMGRVDG